MTRVNIFLYFSYISFVFLKNIKIPLKREGTSPREEAHPQASLVVGPRLKVPDFAKCQKM